MMRWIETIRRQVETGRVVRFLITGVWNSVFGVLVYTLLYQGLKPWVHYLVLLVPANILAITNAYICHKVFVFKTRGNIWREYLRFYVVYGGTAILGFVLMFSFVEGLKISPLVAQFLCIPIIVAVSYVSHRDFSFRAPPSPPAPRAGRSDAAPAEQERTP